MSAAGPSMLLPLRFALRELRGGLGGFAVFLACIALGVAAIAAVGSVSQAMMDGLEREGRSILGGDIAFTLVQRQASPAERAFLDRSGEVSEIATLRGMARRVDGADQTLVEVKAVDGAYPLYGQVELAQGADPGDLDALADRELLTRLDLKVGDAIDLGSARLRLSGTIASEPDKLATGLGFGPRLLVTRAGLDAAKLIQPGSLVQWSYRVKLPANADPAAVEAAAKQAFPDAGWQIRSRDDASPGLRRSIEQFTQYLTLVGLAALVVGGVGVANAVAAFIDAKRNVIATLRAIGAETGFVVQLYLIQILLIAAVGVVAGLVLGALVPVVAMRFLADFLPVGSASSLYPAPLAIAALYGLVTAVTFVLLPLGRIPDIAPAALFRDASGIERGRLRLAFLAAALAAGALLAAVAVWFAYDRRIAAIFVVAIVAAFLVLRAVGWGLATAARAAPRPRGVEARLAIGNLHRPGALTQSVLLSLGLGLALVVTLALIDGSLQNRLRGSLPEDAPSFFFLDVQNSAVDAFTAMLRREAPDGHVESVPMLRGRITRVAGVPSDQVKPAADSAWALQGDRGITFSATPPKNSRLVEGEWWNGGDGGKALVSMEVGVAKGLGLKLGDTITVNVLGREITATVASLRAVEWESLAINFVMVFSPSTFAGAPFTVLTTLSLPGAPDAVREAQLMRDVARAYPTVTAIRVREALDRVSAILGQLMVAIRAASSVALAASVLVLAGAIAAGLQGRMHDTVVLKTLGATRRQLLTAFGLEYGLL
ncbi:MAG: ABC transporter permease, partial [Rhizobiales bacterium]|nr:ABC transporter permease [Hyphomicrobiales bacterium]